MIVNDEDKNGDKQAWYASKTKLSNNNRIDIPTLKKDVDELIEALKSENVRPEKP